jgi:hypothetical protein
MDAVHNLKVKRMLINFIILFKSGKNRINRKLYSKDSLTSAAISLTLLIITTRNKDDFSSYFKHNTVGFQICK